MEMVADIMPVTLPKVEPIDHLNHVSDVNLDTETPPDAIAARRRSTTRSGNMSNTDRPTSSMTVESSSDVPKTPRLTMPCKECSKEISVTYMVRHLRYFHHIGVEKVERPEKKSSTVKSFNRIVPCTVCGKELSNGNMARHMRRHHPVDQGAVTVALRNKPSRGHYTGICSVCNRMSDNLPRHMKSHDPTDRPFQCMKGCTQMFYANQKILNTHYTKCHKRSGIYSASNQNSPSKRVRPKCNVCGREDGEYHRQSHNPAGRPFTCEKGCPRTYYKTLVALHLHYGKVHSTRRAIGNGTAVGGVFRCKLGCAQTFMTKVALWQHVKLHHQATNGGASSIKREPIDGSDSPCDICGKLGSASHMQIHDSSRPFKCEHGCVERYFKTMNARDSHKCVHHRDGRSSVTKSHMNKTMMVAASAAYARNHAMLAKLYRKMAADEKKKRPKTCKICGKKNLPGHEETHDSVKRKFQCMYGCVERYFRERISLRAHVSTHHRGQPQLDKAPLPISQNPLHVIVNSSAKRRTCQICGVENMSGTHMKTHNSEGKAFMCKNGCVQTYFSNRLGLKLHVARLHPGEEMIENDQDLEIRVVLPETQSLPTSPVAVAPVVEPASSPSSSTATEKEKKSLMMPETPEPLLVVNDTLMVDAIAVAEEMTTDSTEAVSVAAEVPTTPAAAASTSAPPSTGVNVLQRRQESVMQMLLAMPNTPETADARMKLLDLYALCNNA